MRVGLTPEQEAFRDATRQFLAAEAPLSRVRARLGHGWDPELWAREAAELGWPALAVPEADEGFGFGMMEVAVLQEELGRALHPSPYFATACLALPLLLSAGTEAQRAEWVPRLLTGEATGTVGWVHTPHGFGAEDVAGEAIPEGGGYRLTGRLHAVADGASATVLLVALRCEGEVGLFLLQGDQPGLTRQAHSTMDGTRPLASLHLDGVHVARGARLSGGAAVLDAVLDRAAIAMAAEQLGVAEVALDMAVEYAKVRQQFGRPIGSFQAIKHKCADMLVLVESARSAVWSAAAIIDGGGDAADIGVAASMARAWCSDAVFKVTAENIQIHGGIGFTWEHDAHLYFKRAQSSVSLLGDASWHRERLATRLGW